MSVLTQFYGGGGGGLSQVYVYTGTNPQSLNHGLSLVPGSYICQQFVSGRNSTSSQFQTFFTTYFPPASYVSPTGQTGQLNVSGVKTMTFGANVATFDTGSTSPTTSGQVRLLY